eukprot:maker-scaffold5_size1054832-snap-gene-2.9 protein:Tk04024 transcript:maker-scaffold5_size1054832-snap-gene-2.9-mRNA-1 annotation:"hepatic leukemia factor"
MSFRMARNGLVDVGGSVLTLSQPTELWTGPKDHGSNSHNNNQDVINLQYMDLEEFLMENVVPTTHAPITPTSTVEGKIFISESHNIITSESGMVLGSHQSLDSMSNQSSKQYQVNLEQRLDFPPGPINGLLDNHPSENLSLLQPSPGLNGSQMLHQSHTTSQTGGLVMPTSPEHQHSDMVSLRSLNRAISAPHSGHSTALTPTSQTSPMRRYSGDAMVPTPAPSSPTNSFTNGTPSPLSMGGASPTQSHDQDIETRRSSKRGVKRSRKESVPDENKDEKYWRRRAKNNEAAKRSRDLRREKESQIMQRVAFLERENQVLMNELKSVRVDNDEMRKRLSHYEVL